MKASHILPFMATFVILTACNNKHDFDATGIFEATTVTVSAETAGRIIAFNVAEGDTLSRGETIAIVDTTQLQLRLKQLMSQHESTRTSAPDVDAQVSSLRTQIAHQQHECQRIERMLADGAATRKQADDANASLTAMRNQLSALLSDLNKRRASISGNAEAIDYQCAQIQDQILRSTVTSPINGTVLTKFAEAGEYATPGKPLVKLANLGDIYLRCYFTARQLADISLGQQVTVIADFGGDKQIEYPGHITWIADESEFTPKSIQTADTRANLVYAAKVAVTNDGRLKLGQYGEVRL